MNNGGDFEAFKRGAEQELDDAADAVYAVSQAVKPPIEWFVNELDKPIGWLKSKMLKPAPKYNPRLDPTNEDIYLTEPQVFKEDYE